jgi:hypothetical protein
MALGCLRLVLKDLARVARPPMIGRAVDSLGHCGAALFVRCAAWLAAPAAIEHGPGNDLLRHLVGQAIRLPAHRFFSQFLRDQTRSRTSQTVY